MTTFHHTHVNVHVHAHSLILTHTTHSLTQVILDVLSFGKALSDAVPYPRLHHQLEPDYVSTEKDFPEEFVEALKMRNHKVEPNMSRTVVQGIHVDSDGKIHATSDYRKGGKPDGY